MEEQRRRIEFRAGLAVALFGLATLLLPTTIALRDADPGGWAADSVLATAALLMLAVLGFTGWWVDAVREWWGIDHWVHRFRSAAAWLIPFVNLFAISQETTIILERAQAPRWVGRALGGVLMGCVVLSWLEGTAANSFGAGLLAVLPLTLVLVSMHSLRREWQRSHEVIGH